VSFSLKGTGKMLPDQGIPAIVHLGSPQTNGRRLPPPLNIGAGNILTVTGTGYD
jgi:hypothetical protein